MKTTELFNWHGTQQGGSFRAETAEKSFLRQGGLAFVQAYNVEKNIFASYDGSSPPLFSDPSLRSLGYTESTLRMFNAARAGRAVDPNSRRRALQAFKKAIIRLENTLCDIWDNSTRGYSARHKGRMRLRTLHYFRPPLGSPTLNASHY